jgi:PKD repeat protein
MSTLCIRFSKRLLIALAAAVALSACATQDASAPDLAGPSELGLSIELTASPDVLPRDGVSTSTIRVVARGPDGKPLAGQKLVLSTSAGSLSSKEVTTGTNGDATVVLNPLPLNQELSGVVVSATAVAADAVNAPTRTVKITVAGTAPDVSFTVNPASPKRLQLTTLVAAALMNGVLCGTECTYEWKLDTGEVLPSGRTIVYRFQQARAYVVTLVVTAPTGGSAATSRIVTVTPPVLPVAVIAFSPTTPTVADTIRFDGRGSTADPDGDTQIVRYEWDFGDGSAAVEGSLVTHQYVAAKSGYTVRLTVTDNLGRTATTTTVVNVAP